MPKITIFNGSDSEQVILNELKTNGIIGISGGRLEVRAKLEKVQHLINTEGLEGYWAQSTLNHTDTELGYGYDENRYSMQEAQKLTTKSYDEKIA
jgi:hypothetical protein